MRHASSLRRVPFAIVAGLVLLMTSQRASGLREDDLKCEEAVAHLNDCCPNFDLSKISCSYKSGCGSTQYAELGIEDSVCIQNKDCKTLIAEGICTRVLTLGERLEDGGPPSTAPVCQ